MDDLLEIGGSGGIKPIEGGSSSLYQYSQAQQRKKQPIKFKIGEILLAQIEKVISDNEAIISLPNGVFTCYLKGNLKAGDTLFLMVEKTEPVLELRIYAISVISNDTQIEIKEALRILFLPDNSFYRQLIDLFIRMKNLIVRDELLDIHRAYLKIDRNKLKNIELGTAISTLFFMRECEYPLDEEVFLNSYSMFFDISYLNFQLSIVLNNLNLMTNEIKNQFNRLKDLVAKYKKRKLIMTRYVQTIARNEIDNNNVVKLLNAITTFGKVNTNPQYQDIIMSANIISQAFQAQSFWNRIAMKYGGFINAFILYDITDELNIGRLILLKINTSKKYYELPGSEPLSKGFIPDGYMLIENLNDNEMKLSTVQKKELIEYFDDLQSIFEQFGFGIISLSFGKDNITLPLKRLTSTSKGGQNLSFVV